MSQTDEKKPKYDKIHIKPKPGCEDQISTGANTQVYLNGELLGGCCFVKFEAKAKGVTKVLLEMYATVECEANVALEETNKAETPYRTSHGETLALHQLGNYAAKEIVTRLDKDKK